MISRKWLLLLMASIVIMSQANGHVANKKKLPYKKNFGLFFKGKVGLYSSNLGTDTQLSNSSGSFVLGGAIGKKITPALHMDLELNYRNAKNTKFYNIASQETAYKEWKVEAQTLILNGTYHFLDQSMIHPYIKGGIGISRNISGAYCSQSFNKSSITCSPGKTKYSPAWQVAGGLSIRHTNKLGSELEYTYLNRGKSETQNLSITEVQGVPTNKSARGKKTQTIKDHIVTYGVVYSF